MYTAPSEPFIGRCENLREEFLGFLDLIGAPIGAGPRNVSQHGDWHGYYDQALADAVAKYDGTVIERFDYRFTG